MFHLAKNLDECRWEDRLNSNNHVPHFPRCTTFTEDSAPMFVQQAKNQSSRFAHMNGKDLRDCLQFHMCVSFQLKIVSKCQGAHDPKTYDAKVQGCLQCAYKISGCLTIALACIGAQSICLAADGAMGDGNRGWALSNSRTNVDTSRGCKFG